VIASFRRGVDENCVLLGYYAAGSGLLGSTNSWPLKMGP